MTIAARAALLQSAQPGIASRRPRGERSHRAMGPSQSIRAHRTHNQAGRSRAPSRTAGARFSRGPLLPASRLDGRVVAARWRRPRRLGRHPEVRSRNPARDAPPLADLRRNVGPTAVPGSGVRRIASTPGAAFDSDADNLVPGTRTGPPTCSPCTQAALHPGREPWQIDSTELNLARDAAGQAGRRSVVPPRRRRRPDPHGPRCIAFVVGPPTTSCPATPTGSPMRSSTTFTPAEFQAFVSLGSGACSPDGTTYESRLDAAAAGGFVSDASNWPSPTPSIRPPPSCPRAHRRPAPSRSYACAILGDRGNNAGLHGLTFLASADSHGPPGTDSAS